MLHQLKKGSVPDDLDAKVKCKGMANWILSMVEANEKQCPDWEELRSELDGLLKQCKNP